MARKAKKVGGCKVVKFRGKPEPVRFCKKEATPAEKSAKKARARRNLKMFACKASGLSASLKKACRRLSA